MNHLYTRRNITIGLAISLAFISFFVWQSYCNIKTAMRETRTGTATLQSLRALEDIMDDMQDIETGQRGYIISGNRQFLEPYLLAQKKLAQDTINLKNLYPLYPDRKPVFEQLLTQVKTKAETAGMYVSLVDKYGRDSAYRKMQVAGSDIMEGIRNTISSLETQDRIVLRQSNTNRVAAARAAGKLFILLALLFITGLFVLFWRIHRGLKQREQYEQKIAYLAGLTEKTSDAIFSTDAVLIIKSWNNAAQQMYGYTAGEAIGQKIGTLLKIKIPETEYHESFKQLQKVGHYKGEYEAIKKSGEPVHILASVSAMRNDKSVIEGYVAVHRDITERKNAEEVLKTFNEELASQVEEKTTLVKDILERDFTERMKAKEQIEKEKELSDKLIHSLPGIFYWYDENGRFLRWNKQLEVVTGYTAAEIAAMHPADFFEGEDKKQITEKIRRVFMEGIGDAEAQFIARDGSKHPYYFKGIRMIIDGRPSLVGTGIDISDRKKAEQEAEASYKAIRTLTSHLHNVREQERAHIAREIHDELGQQLTVLKMDVSWLKKRIGSDDNEAMQKTDDLIAMLDNTVKSVRRISSELRPSLLDDLGLTAAIEWQLVEFEKRSGITTDFIHPIIDVELHDNLKTAVFRIFQESLTNVARHSNASKVTVTMIMSAKDNNLVLSIADNGSGFDKQKIADKKTLGILGMQERIAMIGGLYDIKSQAGEGTEVLVHIPLNKN